jgi:hypothetical protein
MTRYIDADKFISWLDVGHLVEPAEKRMSDLNVKKAIDLQPTADVVPVIHAHWKNIGSGHAECSNCGMTVSADYPASPCVHYCAKCGAKMDEKTEEKVEEE